MDFSADSGPPDPPPPTSNGEPSLSSIRRILFASESERIDQLDQERIRLESEIDELKTRLATLQAELTATEARLHDEAVELTGSIDGVIARRAQAAPEEMAEALGPVMAGAIRVQDRQSREDLIDAVGPILGDAIEEQIRESRHSLVEALYPIIGEMALRYIGEFFREFQRNIDARLKSTFNLGQFFRRAEARVRGISDADLMVRDALPFQVREVFLIESGTGILLARAGSDEAIHSDLISGMLTAVRDFMHDSFERREGPSPVDEIQYGDQRIIVQDGRLCYLAVLIHGIEPSGFRASLRRFVSQLHADHHQTIQTFDGDMSRLDAVQSSVDRLAIDLAGEATTDNRPKPLSRGQKLALAGAGFGGMLLLGLACFYLQFTLALLPVAFGSPSPTPTMTATSSPTLTSTPTMTPTSPPTATATATPSPTHTPTATSEPTATTEPTAEATVVPFTLMAGQPVWVYSEPSMTASTVGIIEAGTPLTLIEVSDPWLLIEWQSAFGPRQGWLSARLINVTGTPPADFPTPATP